MFIASIELSNGHKRARKTPLAGCGAGPKGEAEHVHGAGEAVEVIAGPGIAGPGTTVSFGGNGVIMTARVALLFYGSAWKDVSLTPNAGTIITAVRTILASPYCDVLAVVQQIGRAHV